MRQAGGQGDGGEIHTKTKSTIPDMRQAGGQGDGGEFLTPRKSAVPNMRQGIGQGDGGEILTTFKSTVPDMRQAGGQGDGSETTRRKNNTIESTATYHLAALFYLIRFKIIISTFQQLCAVGTVDHSVLVFDAIGYFLIGGFGGIDFFVSLFKLRPFK